MSADKMESVNLGEKMKEVLAMAQQAGVEQNFFFVSTFKRYQVYALHLICTHI